MEQGSMRTREHTPGFVSEMRTDACTRGCNGDVDMKWEDSRPVQCVVPLFEKTWGQRPCGTTTRTSGGLTAEIGERV